MSSDDPRRAQAAYAEPAATQWAVPAGTSSALAAPKLKQTVMYEGEMVAPSTLRMTEQSAAGVYTAQLCNQARQRRRAMLVLLLVTTVAVSALSVAVFREPGVCFALSVAILGVLPAMFAWRWASFDVELSMSNREFSLLGRSFMGPGHARYALETVHGFGFQRSLRGLPRYQLVVVFHSGMTTAIDLPCTRMEEVRFVARRLNAELARAQESR
jgi:hypothetical protein